MSWIDDVLHDFGRGMGIANFKLDRAAVAGLTFERRGALFFERITDTVLVYLARRTPSHDRAALERALRCVHYREAHPLPVQVGLLGEDTLVLLARLDERAFSLPALEQTVALLTELHDRVTGP
ncbi:MAG TPA: type III secretion chaperone SycN [Candidatus Competibacteraceae bacterium]|nr:type III secretion chaperone SycN [Candidatus Competibacteraceae bacterium]